MRQPLYHKTSYILSCLLLSFAYICSTRYGNLDNSRIVLRVLRIPIQLRIIGILKTRSTILELAVRVLGIWTVLEFLKSAK